MYEIRQATVADWPLLDIFIRSCYGADAHYKRAVRWRWQFIDTPYGSGGHAAPVWIALHEGHVVGQIALQPAEVRIEGTLHGASWIVDVMVDPAHRGVGLGHQIHDAIKATGQTLFTLTMAEATRRIAMRAGCITLGSVNQMVRVQSFSGRTITTLVAQRTEPRPGWRAAGRVFNGTRIGPAAVAELVSAAAGLRIRTSARRNAGDNRSVHDVTQFNVEAIDEIARVCAAKMPALFDRSSKFCQWRFRAVPDLAYRTAEFRRDGAVAGVAVCRLPDAAELPVGILTDVMVDPEDSIALDTLVAHAIENMAGKCEAIAAGASHPAHVAALSRAGFVTVKRHRPTVVTTDTALSGAIARLKDQWHLTKADHDWDQIHPA